MIKVTRLNGSKFILNCELIKMVEETPDTMITLTTGERILVKEQVDEIVQSTVKYHKSWFAQMLGAVPGESE